MPARQAAAGEHLPGRRRAPPGRSSRAGGRRCGRAPRRQEAEGRLGQPAPRLHQAEDVDRRDQRLALGGREGRPQQQADHVLAGLLDVARAQPRVAQHRLDLLARQVAAEVELAGPQGGQHGRRFRPPARSRGGRAGPSGRRPGCAGGQSSRWRGSAASSTKGPVP